MTIAEEPQLDVETKRTHRAGPAPFSASYDKARRSYGVATALLLAWALVGIELDKAPLASVKVTLKSPEATPYVFVVAVLYFAFRFTVEWYQAEAGRRGLRASRVDYTVAHTLGASAILIFTGQRLWHVQLADALSAYYHHTVTFAVAFVSVTWLILDLARFDRRRRVKAAVGGSIAVAIMLAVAGLSVRWSSGWSLRPLIPAALAGITAGIVIGVAILGRLSGRVAQILDLLVTYWRIRN